MISTKSHTESSIAEICDFYSATASPIPDTDTKLSHQLYFDEDSECIRARSLGTYSNAMLKLLNKHFGFSYDLTKQSKVDCNGHSFLRYVNNLCLAENLNRIIKQIRKDRPVLLIDVGAKYASVAPLLQKTITHLADKYRFRTLDFQDDDQRDAYYDYKSKRPMELVNVRY